MENKYKITFQLKKEMQVNNYYTNQLRYIGVGRPQQNELEIMITDPDGKEIVVQRDSFISFTIEKV